MSVRTQSADRLRPILYLLGDLTDITACPTCQGSGRLHEEAWLGGDHEVTLEVTCDDCDGQGVVVALVCPRCSAREHACTDDHPEDYRACHACAHEAPHAHWLPENHGSPHQEETA